MPAFRRSPAVVAGWWRTTRAGDWSEAQPPDPDLAKTREVAGSADPATPRPLRPRPATPWRHTTPHHHTPAHHWRCVTPLPGATPTREIRPVPELRQRRTPLNCRTYSNPKLTASTNSVIPTLLCISKPKLMLPRIFWR